MKINSDLKILGSKIILVPYKKKHVEKYHIWMQDETLLELTASEPLTLSEEYDMQKSWYEDEDKCTFIILDKEIMDKNNNEIDAMIGDVNLYLNDHDDPNSAEIEVMIADSVHRSKGKGKEALLFMIRYGIEALHLHKFVAKIKMKNNISIELFKKIGFTEVNRNPIFKEVEMICEADVLMKSILNETKAFEIKDY